jgi:hypothetical protein
MGSKTYPAEAKSEEQGSTGEAKEISIAALMTVREMVGWSKKTVLFTERYLSELLKQLTTKEGAPLFDIIVQRDGAVSPEYMVWVNNRPVKEEHSLDILLQSGDRVVLMPVMHFAAGG